MSQAPGHRTSPFTLPRPLPPLRPENSPDGNNRFPWGGQVLEGTEYTIAYPEVVRLNPQIEAKWGC